jgi:hypothetical protein
MQFVCNGCVGDPCMLVVDDTFFLPKNCPFDNSIGTVDWKPESAKNTEQPLQPDSTQ